MCVILCVRDVSCGVRRSTKKAKWQEYDKEYDRCVFPACSSPGFIVSPCVRECVRESEMGYGCSGKKFRIARVTRRQSSFHNHASGNLSTFLRCAFVALYKDYLLTYLKWSAHSPNFFATHRGKCGCRNDCIYWKIERHEVPRLRKQRALPSGPRRVRVCFPEQPTYSVYRWLPGRPREHASNVYISQPHLRTSEHNFIFPYFQCIFDK